MITPEMLYEIPDGTPMYRRWPADGVMGTITVDRSQLTWLKRVVTNNAYCLTEAEAWTQAAVEKRAEIAVVRVKMDKLTAQLEEILRSR